MFHLRLADSKATKKYIFTADYDWGSEIDIPREHKNKIHYDVSGQRLPSTPTSTPKLNIHDAKVMLCIW